MFYRKMQGCDSTAEDEKHKNDGVQLILRLMFSEAHPAFRFLVLPPNPQGYTSKWTENGISNEGQVACLALAVKRPQPRDGFIPLLVASR